MIVNKIGNRTKKIAALALGAGMMSISSLAHAQEASGANMPSREEMWEIIQKQQSQIDQLLNQQAKTEKKVQATATKVEATETKVSEVQELAKASPAAGGNEWFKNTQLGGYGELHYNGGQTDDIDLHRFVLFLGHDFNERIRLFSEFEIEHSIAGEGQTGEVEMEQAFVEFDLDEQAKQKAKAGVFLLPIGIMNEKHEPTTFFGVERNKVENNIIPTTWWEGGLAHSAELGNGFSTDVAVHSGLKVLSTGSNAYKVRNGRQKVGNADAKDPAVTGRVKWTGMPGVEVAASANWQRDITQSNDNGSSQATLVEAHTDIRKGPFGLKVLGARWNLDNAGAEVLGRDVQQGWYAEPAYYFETPLGEAGIFARYTQFDNEAGNDTESRFDEYNTGVNFWPHPDVVLKADYQHIDPQGSGNSDDIVNLGVGFVF